MAVKEYESDLGFKILVDQDKCEGIGNCIEECPTDVYELQDNKAVPVRIDECVECCLCVDACPTGAIEHTSC